MKKGSVIFAIIFSICFCAFTAFAESSDIKNVYMAQDGTLDANFTMDELISAGELLIYQDDKTGFKATAVIEENIDYAYKVEFIFEDGNAFFGFKTDIDYEGGNARLVGVHSKTAKLPHRVLTDYEYSSQPYGEVQYIEEGGFYTSSIGYVAEVRKLTLKGIKGQGVTFDMYGNGKIRIRSTVLDTDVKGGYDARSFEETIAVYSTKIILALFVAAFGLKHFMLDNVSKNSAELLEQKKNSKE